MFLELATSVKGDEEIQEELWRLEPMVSLQKPQLIRVNNSVNCAISRAFCTLVAQGCARPQGCERTIRRNYCHTRCL